MNPPQAMPALVVEVSGKNHEYSTTQLRNDAATNRNEAVTEAGTPHLQSFDRTRKRFRAQSCMRIDYQKYALSRLGRFAFPQYTCRVGSG
jgi:hypothetical protein